MGTSESSQISFFSFVLFIVEHIELSFTEASLIIIT